MRERRRWCPEEIVCAFPVYPRGKRVVDRERGVCCVRELVCNV